MRVRAFSVQAREICASSEFSMEPEIPDVVRKLSDDPTLKKRLNGFFLDEAYGSLFLNMIADVVVRFMCAFVLPLLSCCLAFGCCRRGKRRKDEFSKRQLQQLSLMWEESGRAAWVVVAAQVLQEADAHRRSPESTSTSTQVGDDGILPRTDGNSKVNGFVDKTQRPDVRKRLNGFIKHLETDPDRRFVTPGSEISAEAGASSSDGAGSSTTAGSSAHEHEHVLDIPVLAVLPSTASLESGDELKGLFKVKLAMKFIKDMFSSRILQANVKPTVENLRALRDLAVEGMKIDREFTLQIDRFFMYYCEDNPEEPVLLNLRDFEVPTILQAEYVAGVLTIRGHHLEGAEIRVATSDEYLIIHPEKQEKGSISELRGNATEIEVWRCTDLLLPVKLDTVQVFASKGVCIQRKNVILRSEATPLIDNTLSTVMREWIPTAILVIFTILHLLSFVTMITNFTLILELPQLWLSYLVPSMVIYILQIIPHGVESKFKHGMNKLKLVFSIFKFTPLVEPIFIKRKSESYASDDSKQSSATNTPIQGAQCSEKGKQNSTASQGKEKSTESQARNYSPINLDWEWLTTKQEYLDKKWVTAEVNDANTNRETTEPFEVIYRMNSARSKYQTLDFENYLSGSNVIVKIYSKVLQVVLQKLIGRHLRIYKNYAEIEGRYILQLYLQEVLGKIMNSDAAYVSTIPGVDLQTVQLHVFHLIRFIEKEYEKSILRHREMIEEGIVSWHMLWTIFQENEKAIYYCRLSKEELCGKMLSCQYKKTDSYKKDFFEIELEVWDYDCVNYEPKIIKRQISEFSKQRRISTLDVHPVKYQQDVAAAEAFFSNRGKMYHKLVLKTERCYMQYCGSMFWSFYSGYSTGFGDDKRLFAPHRESVDGRVMIDQASYAKMKPNRNMGTAQPANGWLQGNLQLSHKDLPSEDDPSLQYAPTIVYGFSFSLRKWGCFLISQLQEITFYTEAFDTLVMKEEGTKKMLLAMTKYYIQKPKFDSIDPLPHKGKGSIILLHGPPGTGKTLTVEALAEKMECPLWQLSVSTLHMTPKKLETRLMKKFEVAALWGAILLLDEADVYLSPRKYSPLAPDASHANALTGVFLRILEYYKGILFLTTNQVDHFEPAIYSRISLFLKYQPFNEEGRQQLWSNFMRRVGIEHATPSFWKEVLPVQLNGRVIRNIVSNAQILCESDGKILNEDHVLDAFRVMSADIVRSLFPIQEKPEERDGEDYLPLGGSVDMSGPHLSPVSDNQST